MDKKIIAALIVLLFCVGCLGIASAENSTNETAENNESQDMSNHIIPISITGKGIEFSDGFTGFSLDSTKEKITTDDGFDSQKTGNDKIQNYVKLAIIEAYRQGCEDNLARIIENFADGSYENSNDRVVVAVLKSNESIGDNATVELEDSMEGSFEFELLKDVNGKKSDCLAYKVSLKEIPNDGNATPASDNATEDNATDDSSNSTEPADNQTDDKQDDKKIDNKTDDNEQKEETIVNETNVTIENKTNTVVVNENNTTVINQNNHKIVKTSEAPKKATPQDTIMKTVGNPIFLLVVVIVIVAIAAVIMHRKD